VMKVWSGVTRDARVWRLQEPGQHQKRAAHPVLQERTRLQASRHDGFTTARMFAGSNALSKGLSFPRPSPPHHFLTRDLQTLPGHRSQATCSSTDHIGGDYMPSLDPQKIMVEH
jgi:hypothetical protein